MSERDEDTITGGAGHGPDKPIDQAASTQDEEPSFAGSTPDAPPISPPGDAQALERMRREDAAASSDKVGSRR